MRRLNDFYPTPAWATEVLLEHVSLNGSVVLEPCAGEGHISNILKDHCFLTTNDIDPRCQVNSYLDAKEPSLYDIPVGYDWVVTNPPFNQALDIVRLGVEKSNKGAAFLLRLSFLEPTFKRQDWLAANPPNKILVLPRISFTGDGKTDSVTCAWMVWDDSNENYVKVIKKNAKEKT